MKESLNSLEKKLDRIFSNYIRLRDADLHGRVVCCTCGRDMPWQEAHAGHFVKRQYKSLRWEEKNVHPQCVNCNTYHGGAQDEYADFILKKYGHDEFQRLMRRKHFVVKFTADNLREKISEYQKKYMEKLVYDDVQTQTFVTSPEVTENIMTALEQSYTRGE